MKNQSSIFQSENKTYNIRLRALELASQTASFLKTLPRSQASLEYARQVIRSSASIGANLEEADGTLSRKDFVNRVSISRREARESRYWLCLLQKVELAENSKLSKEADRLIEEAREIVFILSAMIHKTQAKKLS